MDVRYGVGVDDRPNSIDRAAWAETVQDLINTVSKGNQAEFGRIVGVSARTINRWLTQDVDVAVDNVRAVARATRVRPTDLLVRVGYLTADEVNAGPNPPLDPDVRRWMAILADPGVPFAQKALMREQMRIWAAQIEAARDTGHTNPGRAAAQ